MVYKWVVFYHNGKELMRYSVNGTHSGELQETKNLLAYELGVGVEEITVKLKAR